MQSHPLCRMCFNQYQVTSAVLKWPGYRQEKQSGGWPYPYSMTNKKMKYISLILVHSVITKNACNNSSTLILAYLNMQWVSLSSSLKVKADEISAHAIVENFTWYCSLKYMVKLEQEDLRQLQAFSTYSACHFHTYIPCWSHQSDSLPGWELTGTELYHFLHPKRYGYGGRGTLIFQHKFFTQLSENCTQTYMYLCHYFFCKVQ